MICTYCYYSLSVLFCKLVDSNSHDFEKSVSQVNIDKDTIIIDEDTENYLKPVQNLKKKFTNILALFILVSSHLNVSSLHSYTDDVFTFLYIILY